MVKWKATLSTTDPYNYVGIINVRQGNKNTEVFEVDITENSLLLDLTDGKVFFESHIDNKFPIQRPTKIIDAKKGLIHYTFDEYSMQSLHRQEAYFSIYKGDDLIGTTQNFSYFVVNAASKTEGEMGSYWQSIEDLIADMTAFINDNKGDFTAWMNARKEEFEAWQDAQKKDFTSWFESIKDILKTVDPGGTMLAELMDARIDMQGFRHSNLNKRMISDLEAIYKKIKLELDKVFEKKIPTVQKYIIEHDSLYEPEIKARYYVNAIGSEEDGFDALDELGEGTIYSVPIQTSYDTYNVSIEVPAYYVLKEEAFVSDSRTAIVGEKNRTLHFEVFGAKIQNIKIQ